MELEKWEGDEEEERKSTESAYGDTQFTTIYGDFSGKTVGSWPQLAASPIQAPMSDVQVSTLRGPLEIKAIYSLSWTSSVLPPLPATEKGRGKLSSFSSHGVGITKK